MHLLGKRSFDMHRRLVSSESVSHLRHDIYSSNLALSYVRIVFHDFYEIDIGKCDVDTVFGRTKFVQRNEERSDHVYNL